MYLFHYSIKLICFNTKEEFSSFEEEQTKNEKLNENQANLTHKHIEKMLSEENLSRALETPLWTKKDMDDIFNAHVCPIPRLVNQSKSVNFFRFKKDFILFKN